MHRGLYYIYPEVNFYFGKAESTKGSGTIYHRHKTHRPKLDVNLAALYGPPNIKCEPKWTFPKGWKEGVAKFLIEACDSIPVHFSKVKDENIEKCKDAKTKCQPENLDFTVNHKVDIDTLPVLVWDLDHFSEEEIYHIETAVITTIWPYCNDETYRKRNYRTT